MILYIGTKLGQPWPIRISPTIFLMSLISTPRGPNFGPDFPCYLPYSKLLNCNFDPFFFKAKGRKLTAQTK